MSSPNDRPCSLGEAILWSVGYMLAQGIALLAFLTLLICSAYGFDWPRRNVLLELALDLNLDRSFLLIGATSLGALFLILPAVRLRQGKSFREQFGWRVPTRQEFIFASATVLPIAVLGDATYDLARSWLEVPQSGLMFASAIRPEALQHLHESFAGVPYGVLVVAMALGPAIGEEIVFRGVIGRGLIRRWGLLWGTGISALLFAVVHGSVAHAVAVIPVAILLQLLYLQTNTIWVPVLVHFGNNLLAVTMVRFQLPLAFELTPHMLLGFVGYLTVILGLMEGYRRTGRACLFPISA